MTDEKLREEWLEFVGHSKKSEDQSAQKIRIIKRLERPDGIVDTVLDTDTYNEIDDQYALAYMLKSDDKIRVKAIYSAPFTNSKSKSPKDGMEKSYEEIRHILQLMGQEKMFGSIYKGSEASLPDEKTPVISDAAKDLAKRAMEYSEDNPLYVIAIAAITNIASAILMNPEIVNRIVIVWLGGNALEWPDNKEFNLYQDIAGARLVFGCGVPLVQLPCMGVVSAFTVSGPELEAYIKGKNGLCNYLADYTAKEAAACGAGAVWSRPIWDVTAVGWLLGKELMYDRLEYAPIPEYDHRYSICREGHFYKYVYHINRDKLLADLVEKLTK